VFEEQDIFILGRLPNWPRQRLRRVLAGRGAALAARLDCADQLVVASGAVLQWRRGTLQRYLDQAEGRGIPIIGERAFLRMLGFLPALREETRSFSLSILSERSGLAVETLRLLALFEVIEGQNGQFGFRELKAAREAARLLSSGLNLGALVLACQQLRRALALEVPLAERQLELDESGDVVLQIGERHAETSGQLRLDLGSGQVALEDAFQPALEAERKGDDGTAERLYRLCLDIAPDDGLTCFNLGNVLLRSGRAAEALALWQKAAALDPQFADAWYNVGCLLEEQGRLVEAVQAFRKALDADGGFAEPCHRLGILALDAGRFDEARRHFTRYLELDDSSETADEVRRSLKKCEMEEIRTR
jgi:tetratricopeptide (TPR) repeat protein